MLALRQLADTTMRKDDQGDETSRIRTCRFVQDPSEAASRHAAQRVMFAAHGIYRGVYSVVDKR